MRQLAAVVFCSSAILAFAGCGSDDESEPESAQVEVVAGGGETVPGADPVSATDARLEGMVTGLNEGSDGSLWGVLDNEAIVNLADGDIRMWEPELPDGASGISDLAAGPDDEVYLLLDGAAGSVHAWEPDAGVRPVFGTQAAEEQLAADAPVTPDGADAEGAVLGEIADIDVDADGRVVFAESLLPDGAGLVAASLVRAVDENGDLVTIAGRPWSEPGVDPETDEIRGAALPPDEDATPTSVDLLGPIAVSTGAGGEVLVRTGWSILAVDGDELSVVLGPQHGDENVPAIRDAGPFSSAEEATAVSYRAVLDARAFAVNADGDILAGAMGNLEELDSDSQAPYVWDVDGASDTAQAVAESRSTDPDAHSTVLVTADGEVFTADLSSSDATWFGDGTVAVSTYDPGTGQSIIAVITPPDGTL